MRKEFATQSQKECSLTYSLLIHFPKFAGTALRYKSIVFYQNIVVTERKNYLWGDRFYKMEREESFLPRGLQNYFQRSFFFRARYAPFVPPPPTKRCHPLSFLPHWALCLLTLTFRSPCIVRPCPRLPAATPPTGPEAAFSLLSGFPKLLQPLVSSVQGWDQLPSFGGLGHFTSPSSIPRPHGFNSLLSHSARTPRSPTNAQSSADVFIPLVLCPGSSRRTF